MTKLNLTIKTTKNYQTVEISATDIDTRNYEDTKLWLIYEAQNLIEILSPGENVSQQPSKTTTSTNYKPASNPKGAMASQKQINLLRSLGYTGDANLSVTEASSLIDQYKSTKK